ncbi:hypothetical protein F3Y22_tig00110927pilonHSYRG00032 [Hibiscus syriacus]|uniref:Protein kinase domain-containing protein n=1 Tax=Hibiscus syriacus TaxID=106335 RepID=A0A6A2ZDI4_HIBSY|nr:hypothetical protein F3Y22_tig00110927pilonHSYRG00032 [Hibiscus syriacus]
MYEVGPSNQGEPRMTSELGSDEGSAMRWRSRRLVFRPYTTRKEADRKLRVFVRRPLCDFGLATWTSAPSIPFLCKTVKGAFGYLAPEYFQHGKVYDKTDVYAFGVVLLELITGRKPIEEKPLLHRGVTAVAELLDPRLKCKLKNSTQIALLLFGERLFA